MKFFKRKPKDPAAARGGHIAMQLDSKAKALLVPNGPDSATDRAKRFADMRYILTQDADRMDERLINMAEELGAAYGSAAGVADAGRIVLASVNALNDMTQHQMMSKIAASGGPTPGQLGLSHPIEGVDQAITELSRTKSIVTAGVRLNTMRHETYKQAATDMAINAVDFSIGQAKEMMSSKAPLANNMALETVTRFLERLEEVNRYHTAQNGSANWCLLLIEAGDNSKVLDTTNGLEAFSRMISHMVMSQVAEAMGRERNDTDFTPDIIKKAISKLGDLARLAEADMRAHLDEKKSEEKPAADPKKMLN